MIKIGSMFFLAIIWCSISTAAPIDLLCRNPTVNPFVRARRRRNAIVGSKDRQKERGAQAGLQRLSDYRVNLFENIGYPAWSVERLEDRTYRRGQMKPRAWISMGIEQEAAEQVSRPHDESGIWPQKVELIRRCEVHGSAEMRKRPSNLRHNAMWPDQAQAFFGLSATTVQDGRAHEGR